MSLKPVEIVKEHGGYAISICSVSYSIVTPLSGTKYAEISTPHACREVIAQQLMYCKLTNGRPSRDEGYGDKPLYDLNRMRIAIEVPLDGKYGNYNTIYKPGSNKKNSLRERVFATKRIINIYEEFAKFGKTKVMPATNGKNSDAWIFNAPKGWMYSSSLMSLYLLLIRIGVSIEKRYLDILDKESTVDGLSEAWRAAMAHCMERDKTTMHMPYWKDLCRYMYRIIEDDRIKIILGKRRSLFNGTDRFPVSNRVAGGVDRLCIGSSHDSHLDKKFIDLVKENKDADKDC